MKLIAVILLLHCFLVVVKSQLPVAMKPLPFQWPHNPNQATKPTPVSKKEKCTNGMGFFRNLGWTPGKDLTDAAKGMYNYMVRKWDDPGTKTLFGDTCLSKDDLKQMWQAGAYPGTSYKDGTAMLFGCYEDTFSMCTEECLELGLWQMFVKKIKTICRESVLEASF